MNWPLEPWKSDKWTTVELVLKKDLKERLPNLVGLARFLISSITFLEKVNTITVSLSDRNPKEVLRIHKPEFGSESPVEIHTMTSSPHKMTIKSINFASMSLTLTFCSVLRVLM